MEQKIRMTEEEWFNLIKEAINEGVKIQINYRFKYKGKNLGSFLTYTRRKNNLERIKKLKKLGLDLKTYKLRGSAEDYLEEFVSKLSNDENPNKRKYGLKFTSILLPKKDKLKKGSIIKLNKVWKSKFGEIRNWERKETTEEKIIRWKNFRYNKDINPNEKWYGTNKYIGSLYGWVRLRKTGKMDINLVRNYFNEKELIELRNEGFNIK